MWLRQWIGGVLVRFGADRQVLPRRYKVIERQPDLPQVVRALNAPGSLACGLDGGQEEAHQDADYGDGDEQFEQGEARTS